MSEVYTHRMYTAPYSSALEQVWYNAETHRLWVQFPSGQIAGYGDVPGDRYRQLVDADSIGRYYVREIKPVYAGVSVDQHAEFIENRSGDKTEEEPAEVEYHKFTVVVEVSGELKLDVSAESVEGAMKFVNEALGESVFDGSYTVRSVTRN